MIAAVNSWSDTPLNFYPGNPTSEQRAHLLDEAQTSSRGQQWLSFAAKKVNQQFADQSLPCFGTLEADGDHTAARCIPTRQMTT